MKAIGKKRRKGKEKETHTQGLEGTELEARGKISACEENLLIDGALD